MNNLIKCEICQEECKRIYGAHLKKHGITSKEYKLMFPNAKLMTDDDLTKTIKNSGKHMKTEKYKKMFSKMFSGEKNPNHMSRTTDEERKSRSPFSKNFIKYSGTEEEIKETISEFAKSAVKDRLTTVNLEYWIRKGYSEEDAKSMLKDRQTTFNLDKCIKKYGAEEGHKRWIERQSKWQNSLMENGSIKCGYSKISQDLFFEILKTYNYESLEDIFFSTKNREFFISIKNIGFFTYDFTDRKRNKMIEYNGDLYHANPKIFGPNEFPHPYLKENGPSSQEIWNRDKLKIEIANSKGFDVLTVWDSEYRSDKQKVIKKCLDFLKIS